MNIKKVFFAFVVATAFTACSSDEAITQQDGNDVTIADDADIIEPIRLGYGISTEAKKGTRATVDPTDEYGNFSVTENIGLYMLAIYDQGVNPFLAINWYDNNYSAPLKNYRAKTISVDGKTGLQLVDADQNEQVEYYPLTSRYANRFYGYYPYRNDGSSKFWVTSDGQKVVVTYTGLDGTTDILWGQSDAGEEIANKPAKTVDDQKKLWKYSARYFRINSETMTDYPVIAFQHMLMAFQFKLLALADGNGEYDECEKMKLLNVTIKDVPTTAKLTVADHSYCTSDTWKGAISFDATPVADLTIRDAGDAAYTGTVVNRNLDGEGKPQAIDAGQKILLPVPTSGNYCAAFTFGYDADGDGVFDDETFTSESEIEITQDQAFDYQKGTCYNVILQVAGPQKVVVRATLKDWDEPGVNETLTPIDFN